MERWYHYDPRDGTGLGKREQGILLPIDPAPTAFTNRRNNNKNNPKRPPRADVRIDLTGEHYYIFTKDKIYHAGGGDPGTAAVPQSGMRHGGWAARAPVQP
eukprot:scaffold7282_cov113-Isochrysis_galbana.AAC.8